MERRIWGLLDYRRTQGCSGQLVWGEENKPDQRLRHHMAETQTLPQQEAEDTAALSLTQKEAAHGS